MEEKPYKVYLKEIHWQEVVVDAVSRADAIQRALDGAGSPTFFSSNDLYEPSTCEDGHRVEEF